MDIRIKYDTDTNGFDLGFLSNDLEKDSGLESSIIVSLFSDRRALDSELPPGQTDKRGWWGDAVDPAETDLTGSKLWLLAREKQTEEVLDKAQEYAEEALQWLIDDGVASGVSVRTSYPKDETILVEVEVTRSDRSVLSYQFNLIWEGQANGI
jgi:phage gp46-like protein